MPKKNLSDIGYATQRTGTREHLCFRLKALVPVRLVMVTGITKSLE